MKKSKKVFFEIVPILPIVFIVTAIIIIWGNNESVSEEQHDAPVAYSVPEEEGIDANAPTDYYITENGMMIEQSDIYRSYEKLGNVMKQYGIVEIDLIQLKNCVEVYVKDEKIIPDIEVYLQECIGDYALESIRFIVTDNKIEVK